MLGNASYPPLYTKRGKSLPLIRLRRKGEARRGYEKEVTFSGYAFSSLLR